MIDFRTLGAVSLRSDAGTALPLVQPKRLALFAYLALNSARGLLRRDTLLYLFWPELDAEAARRALRQSLHYIRECVPPSIIITHGDELVGINVAELRCDALLLQKHVMAGCWADALDLYHGELLAGLYVRGAPELEEWLELERASYRETARVCIENLLADAITARERAQLARRWMTIDPFSSVPVQLLVQALVEDGDVAAAHRVVNQYKARTDSDDEDAAALVSFLRQAEPALRPPPKPSPAPTLTARNVAADPRHEPLDSQVRKRASAYWTAAAVVLLLVVIASRFIHRNASDVFAVGEIRPPGENTGDRAALTGLLATSLARVSGLHVVGTTRIAELMAAMQGDSQQPTSLTAAAREAGANVILEGNIVRDSSGELLLDLRSVDAHTGKVKRAYLIRGLDYIALANQASSAIALDAGLRAPLNAPRLDARFFIARRFYEEGLRNMYHGLEATAHTMFVAALKEDSTFAMAALFAGRTTQGVIASPDYGRMAIRFAPLAIDEERLFIIGSYASEINSLDQLALADTLAVRYPLNPDGHLLLARAYIASGNFLAAVPHARRVLALDSISLRNTAVYCRACDAYDNLVTAYEYADSFSRAEQVAREWTQRTPDYAPAWGALTYALECQSKYNDAIAALRHEGDIRALSATGGDVYHLVAILLRAGDFPTADMLMLNALRATGSDSSSALALLWASHRMQGRMREALREAREIRRLASKESSLAGMLNGGWEAQTYGEMGDHRRAAALYDSVTAAAFMPATSSRLMGQHRAAKLTRVADELGAAGDTARLLALADTIKRDGEYSFYARDRRFYHYVRALLWRARGRPVDALREFEASLYSLHGGFELPNREIGRTALELKRPTQAIRALRGAINGPFGASGFSINRTEMHGMLADAWLQAGQRDSAAIEYKRVADAWQNSDREYAAKLTYVKARLAMLGVNPR